jgi:hypothetical protein
MIIGIIILPFVGTKKSPVIRACIFSLVVGSDLATGCGSRRQAQHLSEGSRFWLFVGHPYASIHTIVVL